ncbi:MAG: hypothetical protein ACOC8E_04565 [Planctomycetota bacterium]
MRHLPAAMLLVLAWAGPAPGAEADVPIERFAKLTRETRAVRAETAMELAHPERDLETAMTGTLWLDVETGRVRVRAIITKGEEAGKGATILLRPDGLVRWRWTRDGPTDVWRDLKRTARPGQLKPSEGLAPVNPLLDAALGYPHLAREATLTKAAPPPEQAGDLVWVAARRKPGVEKSTFFGPAFLRTPGAKLLVGFSQKTGWPMAWEIRTDAVTFTLRVTQLDLGPDLDAVFDIPDEVRAKLEQKEEGGVGTPEAE